MRDEFSPTEYRCTKNEPYKDPGCQGHKNISARQGYYIKASSDLEAHQKMAEKYPDEASGGFTTTPWK